MKATSIIIVTVLSLQFSFLFAGNNETTSASNIENGFCTICVLAPVTPAEATFEEITRTNAFNFDLTNLAPVTPVEADFPDVVPEKKVDLTKLSPVTPSEADFYDNTEDQSFDFSVLAPVTPIEADFE